MHEAGDAVFPSRVKGPARTFDGNGDHALLFSVGSRGEMDDGVEIFRQILWPQVEDVSNDHLGRVTLDARRSPLYVCGNSMA